MLRKRPFSIRDILRWADAHREATGKWPTKDSGGIVSARFETWGRVDNALRNGLRGFDGGTSLAQLLAEERCARNPRALRKLSKAQILYWADEYRQRAGEWPTAASGTIPDSGGEKWQGIDTALRLGVRGLRGKSSLARLLAAERGVRNRKGLPPLREEQILAWADAHFQRSGEWPSGYSGPIIDAPGETWTAVQMSLSKGRRGLPGGSSLALLLAEKRGVRNTWTLPNLTIDQILAWVDAFHLRTNSWPTVKSGIITEAPDETWSGLDKALRYGRRRLPNGLSLAKLLEIERDVRNRANLAPLSRTLIFSWAKAHSCHHGQWPTKDSGKIPEAPGETWLGVDVALRNGSRGLRRPSSLAQLLAAFGAKRNLQDLPPLSKRKILAWADAHYQRTGKWPNVNSGEVHGAPGEKWKALDDALRQGHRGLAGGVSLLMLLVQKRGVRNPLNLPAFTKEQIVMWSELHRQRTGKLPKYNSGPIADAPGETWAAVDLALRYGKRTLPRGSSLAKLLAQARECATPTGESEPSISSVLPLKAPPVEAPPSRETP